MEEHGDTEAEEVDDAQDLASNISYDDSTKKLDRWRNTVYFYYKKKVLAFGTLDIRLTP